MKHQIIIPTNPANPVNYLACCGVFDLVARMDAETLGWWTASQPVSFTLESAIPESDLLTTILDTCCSLDRWVFRPANGEPTRIEVHFTTPTGQSLTVPLDWWLETAQPDGSIREKSAWKMFAGQQTIRGIVTDMVAESAKLRPNIPADSPIASLLDRAVAMTGRFGFDPRASRNALDVGYSPNDLQMPVPTFVFAEMLACFGLQSFFPSRTGRAGALASTRGWIGKDEGEGEKGFAYALWAEPMPVSLARVAAACPNSSRAYALFSARAMRKNYSNMTLARTINPSRKP